MRFIAFRNRKTSDIFMIKRWKDGCRISNFEVKKMVRGSDGNYENHLAYRTIGLVR